jgi:peptide/nickel transport system permease protein
VSGMVDDAAGIDPTLSLVPSESTLARRELLRQLPRSRTLVVGCVIVGFWVFWAIVGDGLTPQDPYAVSGEILHPPSWSHWFGTDALGRDVFSRVLVGGREILVVAPSAALLGVLAGTAVGLVAGYLGGMVDDVVGRVIDAVLALPLLVIAVLVIASLGSRFIQTNYGDAATSQQTQIVVIAAIFTPVVARTVRAAVLAERDLDYVHAAQLQGEGRAYVMAVEILPNITGVIVAELTVRLGYAIFAVASLRFLGFGAKPPSPDWSLQISENYPLLLSGTYWWTVLFAALAIATLVVGVQLVTDAILNVVDP